MKSLAHFFPAYKWQKSRNPHGIPAKFYAMSRFLSDSLPQCERHGKVGRQIQSDRRACRTAEPVSRHQSQQPAHERRQDGQQMILPQIPRQIARRGCREHQQRVDDHQPHPAHRQRYDDGDGDGEERLVALRRNAAGGRQLRVDSRFEPNAHKSTTASSTSARKPISVGVTDRISPIR